MRSLIPFSLALALVPLLSGCPSTILGFPTTDQMAGQLQRQDLTNDRLNNQTKALLDQNVLIAEQNKELKRIADALEAIEKKK